MKNPAECASVHAEGRSVRATTLSLEMWRRAKECVFTPTQKYGHKENVAMGCTHAFSKGGTVPVPCCADSVAS